MPEISVVIPCYNDGAYLEETIASVRAQTHKDWEVIIVDDGSTDPVTLEVLRKLEGEGIIVARQANSHLSAARNHGIRLSKADIIVTLDADDRYHPTFFEKAVQILRSEKGTGIVSSHVRHFGADKRRWRTGATNDFSFFTENRVVACCAFRKICWEQVGGYDESMRSGFEDWEFFIRVTKAGWTVHVIPEPLFLYRKKETSMLKDEALPRFDSILDYMMTKHRDWYLASLKKGIIEKRLINRDNLTLRRIAGLFIEKLTGKF